MTQTSALVSTSADDAEQLSWLARLIAARMPAEVGETITTLVQSRLPRVTASVLWGLDDASQRRRAFTGVPGVVDWSWLAKISKNDGLQWHPDKHKMAFRLCELPEPAILMIQAAPQDIDAGSFATLYPLLKLAGVHLRRALEGSALKDSHQQLERSETLQRALFAISDLAGSDRDMLSMLEGIHAIVSTLMYAENFFIVLYDEGQDTIRFLYFVDVLDPEPPLDEGEQPLTTIEHTLTWYVIRDGKARMGSAEELRRQAPGPVVVLGPDSYDWLGVPMRREGQTGGALVVQSYQQGIGFTHDDLALLEFVGSHILTALERKQGKQDLEAGVQLRTVQLAETNRGLQLEILERQRAEHLQAALFRIAELATADIDQDEFYYRVHEVVGELLNAENFFIGLLSDDGKQLTFPYAVDAVDRPPMSRPLGRGLSEYVLRRGSPLRADNADIEALEHKGEIAPGRLGSPATSWLGMPLTVGDAVIGLVTVQSYRASVLYGLADEELLRFVASQIANSLTRRRSAESLLRAYEQLEQRVDERTLALRKEIIERERMQDQLKHQVMHDSLTGLPNRGYLRDRIDCNLALLRQDPQRHCALLYLDVDRFKIINDSLGHLAGDEVLKAVAMRLAGCTQHPDLVARLSGDEFAILLEQLEATADAAAAAQRVMDALTEPLRVAGKDLQITASIGIAMGDERYQAADDLLRDADIALYRAKGLGRKRFAMYDQTQAQDVVDVLALEGELRRALQEDRFEPYFQPICQLNGGKVVGYEALIRWNHPRRGVLLPDDFLKIAEDSGLIEAIDWRMFELSCRRLLEQDDVDTFMTLNVSARHLRHADFDTRLIQMLDRVGLSPSRLVTEVTEGALLEDPDHVRATLGRLCLIGIGIALDDFGIGYSSLSYLHSLPLRILKIDRSFVHELHKGGNTSSTVVAAILALARALDIEVIAEGIETPPQHAALQAMGCDMGQGYLLGRPAPIEHWQIQAVGD